MRRSRSFHLARPLILALAAIGLVGSVAGCGVTANTTAATVLGETISVDDINRLMNDEAFVAALFGSSPDDLTESRQPGPLARDLLLYEIERVVWVSEAERFGATPTEAEVQAAEERVPAEPSPGMPAFEDETRESLIEYMSAQFALLRRFESIDPSDDADLLLLYDGSSSLWDRVCIALARLDQARSDAVETALDDGISIEDLPATVADVDVLVDPTQSCIAGNQLPDELKDAVDDVGIGERAAPVVVDDGAGGESVFVFRLDERQRVGFDDAREELVGIAESLSMAASALSGQEQMDQGQAQQASQLIQSWMQLQAATATINPRYGIRVIPGGDGQLTIQAPPTPVLPRFGLVTEDLPSIPTAPAEMDPAEMDPAEMDPAEMDQSQLDPEELDAAEPDSGAVDPGAPDPGDVGTEESEPPQDESAPTGP